MPYLEDVFLVSGIPTHTFVEPVHYDALRLSLRTPGRCAVIEGPSGIGKTTSIYRLLEEQERLHAVTFLSARKGGDIEYINALPTLGALGTVIVDDFHRLPDDAKATLADFMKVLADEGSSNSKLILIGINKAGDRLVHVGNDLGLRIDVFKMESNPDYKIEELISKGETALNIDIANGDAFVQRSYGSFQIAQMLCRSLCVDATISETCGRQTLLSTSIEAIIDLVMVDLRRMFSKQCIEFARGSKLRREGRAPYLHILRWLSETDDWSLDLRQAVKMRPEHKESVGQVVEKKYLPNMLKEKSKILDDLFNYQVESRTLTVEDPRLVFYLKNLVWKNFTREVGFTTDYFRGSYDIALSFAGNDRHIAESLFNALNKREVSVFYDKNEQHRMLANNIEEYLAPIYRSEAAYVIPSLSQDYPNKIWTKFESDQFRSRFGQHAVIPIRYRNCSEGYFSNTSNYGSLPFDLSAPTESQIEEIANTICRRLEEDRSTET